MFLIKHGIVNDLQKVNAKRPPSLHIINVGDNPASKSYILKKGEFAKACGIHINVHKLNNEPKFSFVRHLITELNDNPNVDGILAQLPIKVESKPYWEICNLISKEKDVDGLQFENVVRLSRGQLNRNLNLFEQDFYINAAPLALDQVLKSINFNPKEKRVAVVGDGPLIGNPISDLLVYFYECTVTRCNQSTQNLDQIISQADLVISGVGNPHIIEGKWIKEGAVVIDFGCSFQLKNSNKKKLIGDVEFEKAVDRVSFITPVPNGIGPVTVAMLMLNLCKSFKTRHSFNHF